MADPYTEDIQKRMDALPPDVKALLDSADMGTVLHQIGEKYQLHIDQIGALDSETVAVMIGLTESNEFAQELADSLNVPKEKADEIVHDVNDRLFVKVRDSLKKLTPSVVTAASLTEKIMALDQTSSVAVAQIAPAVPTITPPVSLPVSITPAPMPAVEKMLTEKTVVVPEVKPVAPAPVQNTSTQKPIYKTDPYREPVE